jgi:alcohol dehydrogenase
MDALSHAVDSLHCLLATPASDALALEGARLVARYIRRAAAAPADIEARCGMAQGSLTAGIAVGLTDVAGAHCLAEAIGGLYGHPHGFCCADSMPPIMEYNLPVSAAKYARLADAFGLARDGAAEAEPDSAAEAEPDSAAHAKRDVVADAARARQAIEFIRQLNRDLGVPPMRDLIRVEDLELLGQKAEQNTSTPSNPRAADAAAFTSMFAREIGALRALAVTAHCLGNSGSPSGRQNASERMLCRTLWIAATPVCDIRRLLRRGRRGD